MIMNYLGNEQFPNSLILIIEESPKSFGWGSEEFYHILVENNL